MGRGARKLEYLYGFKCNVLEYAKKMCGSGGEAQQIIDVHFINSPETFRTLAARMAVDDSGRSNAPSSAWADSLFMEYGAMYLEGLAVDDVAITLKCVFVQDLGAHSYPWTLHQSPDANARTVLVLYNQFHPAGPHRDPGISREVKKAEGGGGDTQMEEQSDDEEKEEVMEEDDDD